MNKDQYRAEGFLVGTIVGAAIAGATALLLAPKSGQELRKDISNQAKDAKDQATDYAQKAKDQASNYASQAKKQASEYADQA